MILMLVLAAFTFIASLAFCRWMGGWPLWADMVVAGVGAIGFMLVAALS